MLLPHRERMLSRVQPPRPLLCEAQDRSDKYFQNETVMLSVSYPGLHVVSVRGVTRANYVKGSPCVISHNSMQIEWSYNLVLGKQHYFAEAKIRTYSSDGDCILLGRRDPNGQCRVTPPGFAALLCRGPPMNDVTPEALDDISTSLG